MYFTCFVVCKHTHFSVPCVQLSVVTVNSMSFGCSELAVRKTRCEHSIHMIILNERTLKENVIKGFYKNQLYELEKVCRWVNE